MTGLFPSPTLTRYLAKMFLTRTFAVLAVLLLVLQVLDLLSESDNILKVAGNGQAELLTYVTWRLPQLVQRFLPFCVLLGALITLVTLNQHSEVVSMKAGGMSAHQVLAPLFIASAAIAVGAFVFNERVVTGTTARLAAWEANEFRALPTGPQPQSNVWIRDGDDLIHVAVVEGRGDAMRLNGVTVYDRDAGRLVRTVTAPDARVAPGGGIVLREARLFDVATGAVTRSPTQTIAPTVEADQIAIANVVADGTRLEQLSRDIAALKRAGRATNDLETAWWHKFSGPLSTMLMPLLGGVAAFGLARSGKLFVRAVIGMALGLAFYVADNFGLAMGDLGAYRPVVAAWGPFILFLLIGEMVLIRTEE